MSAQKFSKLKNLLKIWPPGMAGTSGWLNKMGIYQELGSKYVQSGWLERVDHAVFKKAGDKITWSGVVFALQNQLKLNVHVGGRAAIELTGMGHFLRFKNQIMLYGQPQTRLPRWVLKLQLIDIGFEYTTNHLFSDDKLGLECITFDGFEIIISSLERAIIEMLWQVPNRYSYEESVYIMENLMTLRPSLVQKLLENCRSIKAKRLFLHSANMLHHPWIKKIDLTAIDLGHGIRQISKGKSFDESLQLYVPENPLNNEG